MTNRGYSGSLSSIAFIVYRYINSDDIKSELHTIYLPILCFYGSLISEVFFLKLTFRSIMATLLPFI